MPDLTQLIQQGGAHVWIFVPTAILLGALHGLEPGHSKTMMAAFIIAVRGTVLQAVLLGLAATVSHTAIVWAIALGGMYFGAKYDSEGMEAYLQLASAALILGLAAWMFWRTTRHQHDHDHPHHEEDHDHAHDDPLAALEGEGMDAHQREHAEDIRKRFGNRQVTTGQIVMFGLTGGLIPCPSSITILVLCLQLKQFTLGAALVLCFSIGLALTMVAVGAGAAWSVNHVTKRWSGFEALADRAPFLSVALMVVLGLYTAWLGWTGLTA
jgi:nickel/cobalt exporter